MNENAFAIQRGAAAIQNAFRLRQQQGGKALVAYLMAGDPDLGVTEKIVRTMSGIGVDLIELGMPFSDPLADGPVIQRAGLRSLKQGLTLKKLLNSVRELRLYVDTPIVIMTYYNLFYHYGLEKFAKDAFHAGVDGVIIPDLPPEEGDPFANALDLYGIALIYLVAPTSDENRLDIILKQARGFIYYVSRLGVTGERKDISQDLKDKVQRIRSKTDLPIAVGFGVSEPEQAYQIARSADGIVMGSAIVRKIEETSQMQERAVAEFLRPFLEVLHGKEK